MSEKRYQLAVIGCGVIWKRSHLTGLRQIADRVQVRYVYDVAEAQAVEAAKETGAQRVDDPDRIFDDKAVDFVAVLTPPLPRPGYVRKACAAGKHLLIEKPMARTLSDALDIVGDVRKARAKCFIPFVRAISRERRELAGAVQAGQFGEPLAFVHTALGQPYGWVPLDHWMHDQRQSGGPLFDFSVHFIEMARAFLGVEARCVRYGGAALTGRVKSDDHATIVVDYERGRLGQFTKAWTFPPGVTCDTMTTHVVCRDAVLVMGHKTEVHTPGGVKEFTVAPTGRSGHAEAYLNLIDAIETGAPLYADELCGLRTTEILDAMERSRASGCAEKVSLHE